ncbi:hypothetical protein ACWEV3_29625 [Saccharopolyspora sp. NPDC003752]
MAEPAPNTSFTTAAHRHYLDAQLLREEQRLPNADHLAGVAAECGLKAILTSYLDGYIDTHNRPNHPEHPRTHAGPKYGHLPTLWDEITVVSNGRSGSAFHHVMARGNPFQRWDVAERYADGAHIDAARADQHLAAAHQVLSIYQQAQIDGVLP